MYVRPPTSGLGKTVIEARAVSASACTQHNTPYHRMLTVEQDNFCLRVLLKLYSVSRERITYSMTTMNPVVMARDAAFSAISDFKVYDDLMAESL